MASVSHNLPQIEALLDSLTEALDLTKDGLGEDLLGVVAERIADRNAAQQDPSGGDWAENKGKYGERKRSRGLPVGVDLRAEHRGRMVSLVELQGEKTIAPDSATMTFGTSEESREIAGYFTKGRPGTQDPRPFYEMTEEDQAAVMDGASEHLARSIRGL